MIRTAIVVGVLSASTASAEIAFWFWTVSDTGDEDGFIEPGESALLSLWVGFDPHQVGFSEAGPYTVTGDSRWAAGTIDAFDNLLDPLGAFGDGTLDDSTNTITDIQHFQLSPFFNMDYNHNNPIRLYSIRWTPASYRVGVIQLESDAPDPWIYTDDFGSRTLYSASGGFGTFTVIPTPATAVMFAFGMLGWSDRRRP